MLDLDPGIHLDKKVVAVAIDKKLNSSCTFVFDRFGQFDGIPTHFLTGIVGDEGGRGFFDHLLVAALHGTIAFA